MGRQGTLQTPAPIAIPWKTARTPVLSHPPTANLAVMVVTPFWSVGTDAFIAALPPHMARTLLAQLVNQMSNAGTLAIGAFTLSRIVTVTVSPFAARASP